MRSQRSRLSSALILSLAVFVFSGLHLAALNDDRGRQLAVLAEATQIELQLRISYAREHSQSRSEKTSPRPDIASSAMRRDLQQAREILSRTYGQNSTLMACKVILLDRLGSDTKETLDSLRQSKSLDGQALAADLAYAIEPKSDFSSAKSGLGDTAGSVQTTSVAQAAKVEKDLKERMTPSWYRECALESLYTNSNQPEKLEALLDYRGQRSKSLVLRLWGYFLLAVAAFIAGSAIVVVQLIRVWRRHRLAQPEVETKPSSSANYSWKAVLGVLLAYLSIRIILRYFCLAWYLDLNTASHNMFLVSLANLALFLVGTGSTLLLSYFIAMRPKAVRFLDGINWRLNTGRLDTDRLVLCGLATFLAAVTLIGLSAPISMLIGNRPSTNPIVYVMTAVSQSSDAGAIVILYLLVAVLGPFVEEAFVRGFLYGCLRQKFGVISGIVLSALFFAAIHFDFNSFLQLFILGAVFAIAAERTKSIVPSFIAHGIWNGTMFTTVLLVTRDY